AMGCHGNQRQKASLVDRMAVWRWLIAIMCAPATILPPIMTLAIVVAIIVVSSRCCAPSFRDVVNGRSHVAFRPDNVGSPEPAGEAIGQELGPGEHAP